MIKQFEEMFAEDKEMFSEEPVEPKKCPKCGTLDCIENSDISISERGVLSVNADTLLQVCHVRQQLNALRRIQENGFI